MKPTLSTEAKLELRELQLREAVTRGAFNESRNLHQNAASSLSTKFNSIAVAGFTLSPDTLEYIEIPKQEENETGYDRTRPMKRPRELPLEG